ncbi:uroporphyrinogen-III synthase [Agaribacter flavus]|uniref:Uroporphyrinogen-III synthase n=1 Tax=Agaribacter flavus TaxID=1902781 RepID=A0ABV7FS45_9ALTE
MLLVTRPEPKASKSVSLFKSEHLPCCKYPAINIQLILDAQLPRQTYDIVIVTSTYTLGWLTQHKFICKEATISIGQATTHAIQQAKLPWVKQLIQATQQNSEGVLALPILQDLKAKRVLIVKGKGGRDLLETSLCNKGATVDALAVYERQGNCDQQLIRQVEEQPITCIIVTSVEIATQLFACFSEQWLFDKKWIAASHRIADFLKSKNIENVWVSDSAEDSAIMDVAKSIL